MLSWGRVEPGVPPVLGMATGGALLLLLLLLPPPPPPPLLLKLLLLLLLKLPLPKPCWQTMSVRAFLFSSQQSAVRQLWLCSQRPR